MNPLDQAIFRTINGWPDSQQEFWLFLSKGIGQTSVRIALGILLLGLLSFRQTRLGGVLVGTAWILANLITDLFKAAIPFQRPIYDLPDVIARVGGGSQMGTASAHSANMMCIAVCFLWRFKGWGAPWIVLAVLVGVSRVYVGAHYPSQVLLGWLIGAMTAVIACGVADHAERLWHSRKNRRLEESSPQSDSA